MDLGNDHKTYLPTLLIAFLLSVVGVNAAATTTNTLAPNDAISLGTPTGFAACVTGTNMTCSDTLFTTKIEVAPYLSDYVYSYTQDPNIGQTGSAVTGLQASVAWFSVSALGPGNWTIQVLFNSISSTLLVTPYVNETQPSTNDSDQLTFSLPTSKQWYQFDVTSAVTKSFNELGYVKFRLAGGATLKQMDEIFLIAPPGSTTAGAVIESYFQVVPQGVSQTDSDQYVENEWKILDLSPTLNSTLSGASCALYDLNGTLMNISVSANISSLSTDNTLTARWTANTTLGVQEGKNYEVRCQFTVLGVNITGLEQYVYVSRQSSIWSAIQGFITYVAQIIGLARNPVTVEVIPEYVSTNPTTNIVVSVAKGANQITSNSSVCRVTVIDSVATVVVNNQSMSSFGVASLGMFNYTMNSTVGAGPPYAVRAVCSVNDSANTFNDYLGVGRLQASASVYTPTQIYEGIPSVRLVSGDLQSNTAGRIMAQVLKGSNSVSDAVCGLTVYYPLNTTKILNNVSMSYFGEDGMYNYSWVPPITYGMDVYSSRVSCTGGVQLGALVVQSAQPINVIGGVAMQVVS
jgi:hypothetical protein